MNESNQQNNETPPEPKSWREQRQEWREERREQREARRAAIGGTSRPGVLIVGLLLVILGIVFLLQNSGYISVTLKNWGALFLLIPVVAFFDQAYRVYRYAGNRLTSRARGAFIFGLMLLVATFVILLDLNWAIWGPVIIILAGLGLLLSTVFPNG